MALFTRKSDRASIVDSSRPRSSKKNGAEQKAAQGHPWTRGSEVGSKLIGAMMALGIVAGYLGLGIGWLALNRPVEAVAQTTTESETTSQSVAGGYAAGFVSAWLNASRDDPGELTGYIDLTGQGPFLSPEPWDYRDLDVVTVTPVTDQTTNVLVSANVKETTTDDDENESTTWPRRYWQVVIATGSDGGVSAAGFPAPVNAPAAVSVSVSYPETVGRTGDAGKAVTDFLTAYLTGEGEITRFIAPETQITPIQPTPFSRIDVIGISSNEAITESMSEGDEVRILAAIGAQRQDDRLIPASYALTMTLRAGRWEISQIDPAPLTKQITAPTPPPTDVPTASPTENQENPS